MTSHTAANPGSDSRASTGNPSSPADHGLAVRRQG